MLTQKGRSRRGGLFDIQQISYYLAAGAGSVVVSSFFRDLTTFLPFLDFFTDFFTSFFSVFVSPAGVTVVFSVLTSDFTSAAQTTPAKEMATRAATIVERTFFICTSSRG